MTEETTPKSAENIGHFRGETKLIPIEHEHDPERCEQMVKRGNEVCPCTWKRLEGSKLCHVHDGGVTAARKRREAKHSYRLNQYQKRATEMESHDSLLSLREEVGLVRLLLDNHLELSTVEGGEFMQYSTQVSKLTLLLTRLGEQCATMEAGLENLLSVNNAFGMSQRFISVIAKHATKEQTDIITEQVSNLITSLERPVGIEKRESIYKLKTPLQNELNKFITGERIINLRQEVGIQRIYIEEKLNLCKNAFDITLQAGQISAHIETISTMLMSMHRMEKMAGLLMDAEAAEAFSQALLSFVSESIKDVDVLDKIRQGILETL